MEPNFDNGGFELWRGQDSTDFEISILYKYKMSFKYC